MYQSREVLYIVVLHSTTRGSIFLFLPILKSMTLHPNALNIPMLQRLVITRYMAGEANK